MQIHASSGTADLNKFMKCAQLLITIDNCESSQTALVELKNELSVLREQMALLTDQVAALRVNQTQRSQLYAAVIVTVVLCN